MSVSAQPLSQTQKGQLVPDGGEQEIAITDWFSATTSWAGQGVEALRTKVKRKKMTPLEVQSIGTPSARNVGGQVPSMRRTTRSSSSLNSPEVLKAMRNDAKLVDLGADIRSIKRTRRGEI